MRGPSVTVISETKQEFKGETYYLCGNYFQHLGKRLHREVWRHYRGDIPAGCHIHHVDGDRANNNIENLVCMTASEHESKHGNTEERLEYGRMHIERIRPKAVEWHKSEAGLAWHSRQGKENYEKRKLNTYVCTQCGKEFRTKHVYAEGANHFCGNNCKAKYRRDRLKKEGTA